MTTAEQLQAEIAANASPRRALDLMWFFKTAPGEYGEGDEFLGLTVPTLRGIAKGYYDLPFAELDALLDSPIHEHRFSALLVLVRRAKKQPQETVDFYLAALARGRVNNWDLVDLSAGPILGGYLLERPRDVLFELAASESLWERRVAMVATQEFIRAGEAETTFAIAELLLEDREDLIQKAVGWMLREVGKRVDRTPLLEFLERNAARMPRTMLSYAIEHLSPEQKAHFRALR